MKLSEILIFIFTIFPHNLKAHSRQKRQFSFGFGLPNISNGNNAQNIGGIINDVIGGFLGTTPSSTSNNQGQNINNGNGQNFNPGQVVTISPVDIFNQFARPFIQASTCNVNNGGCEQGCLMRRGRTECYCQRGYILRNDRKTCQDIDECRVIGERPCQERCTNTVGSFQCSCTRGSVLLQDGRSCGVPAASCIINNGGCEQICEVIGAGIQCGCSQGFSLGSDGRSCVDVDECSSGTHSCSQDENCINSVGGFQCEIENHRPSCTINNGGCQHKCSESGQAIVCSCRKNFELNKDEKTCKRVNSSGPCSNKNGGCEHQCRVRNNQARCSCKRGYGLRKDKRSCFLRPNCNVNNGGCDHFCRTNKRGLSRCACRRNFYVSEDARSCIKETTDNPCSISNGGCDQICSVNNGVVKCLCKPGYDFADGICKEQTNLPTNPMVIFPTPPNPPVSSTLPPSTDCGVNTKKSTFRTRIVGGQPADPKDWPWMAALLRSVGKRQFCGGTLITDKHVLSAAHCVYTFRPSDIYVRLGEYDFKRADENNPTDFRVNSIKVHEKYNSRTQENDIAVLKLERSSSFSEFIWPACLPPVGDTFQDQRGYVTGWGTVDFGGPVSNVLLEVVLPIWAQQDCKAAYPENVISDEMMCAGLRAGGKDSCQGDSGGPFLIQKLPSSRWYVAGIVSWGKECAKAGNPGVYTRVNKYLEWIKENSD